jgi:cytochrome c oxidase cbb3-type subunit I/II
MYSLASGPEQLEGVTPYTPLEQAGRDIYVREGCYNCHSQMVRPFRNETLRYGPWSRAGEYAYDHPFQLGSRRIGPDLHRVGGKYEDAWHYEHLLDPRSTSPSSIMPAYTWLAEGLVEPDDVMASIQALQTAGVPYTDDEILAVPQALLSQQAEVSTNLEERGIHVDSRSEIVALIAYLQRLGVDGQAAIAVAEAQDHEEEDGS